MSEKEERIAMATDDLPRTAPATVRDAASDLRYRIDDNPPWYLSIFLGFQHYLTMFGATMTIAVILTPAMCVAPDSVARSEILGTLFFVSGMVTLFQSTLGVRLPIIQGGTFSFLLPTFAILSLPEWTCPAPVIEPAGNASVTTLGPLDNTTADFQPGTDGDEIWKSRMREIQGAIICASLVQVLVGATGIIGVLLRFIGPITIATTISLIGISLFETAAMFASKQWGIAIMTMVFVTVFSQYLRNIDVPICSVKRVHKKLKCGKTTSPVFKMFPVILAIMLSWMVCLILTVTDVFPDDPSDPAYNARTDTKTSIIEKAAWFRLPYPFQWGIPTVSLAGTLGMLSGVIAGMLESVGDYYACARMSGAPPPPVHAINRGITVEGLGCVLAGMWGSGTGTTSYSENIGAIGITKVGSRRVIQVAAIVMMIFGTLGKFGALFVTIPDPVIGGIFMIMFGVIAAVGISNLQYVELNSSRNLFVFGVSMFFGLSLPHWIGKNPGCINTGAAIVDQILTVLLMTSMFIGGSLAFFLDNTVPGTLEERGLALWRQQIKDESRSGEAGSRAPTTYDFPCGMRKVRQWGWTRYVPFCPTFTGCRKQRKDVTFDLSFPDLDDANNGGVTRKLKSDSSV